MQLPSSIKAQRLGHWSYGSETEYDHMGEQAPVTWTCNCGSTLCLEHYDTDTERYVATPESSKVEFLTAHASCAAKPAYCFHCGVVEVKRQGDWCDKCADEDDSVF